MICSHRGVLVIDVTISYYSNILIIYPRHIFFVSNTIDNGKLLRAFKMLKEVMQRLSIKCIGMNGALQYLNILYFGWFYLVRKEFNHLNNGQLLIKNLFLLYENSSFLAHTHELFNESLY